MKSRRNERELKENRDKQINVIGLTGGIGSGKTVATECLRNSGYTVIDADEISRSMFGKGTKAERELLALFPQAESNGTLDRALLRKIISENKTERLRLNDFTHPLIISEAERLIKAAPPSVILAAPLLFETALSRLCDVIVCVYCPRETRIARILSRDNITRENAERMIDTQIPDTERAVLSDYIVPSNVPIDDFRAEITELFNSICRKN